MNERGHQQILMEVVAARRSGLRIEIAKDRKSMRNIAAEFPKLPSLGTIIWIVAQRLDTARIDADV